MNGANPDDKLAKLDPMTEFGTPEAVLSDTGLTEAQKVEILRGWEYDAVEESVAQEEGMGGGEPSMLQRVHQALESLSGGDTEKPSPTKHG